MLVQPTPSQAWSPDTGGDKQVTYTGTRKGSREEHLPGFRDLESCTLSPRLMVWVPTLCYTHPLPPTPGSLPGTQQGDHLGPLLASHVRPRGPSSPVPVCTGPGPTAECLDPH